MNGESFVQHAAWLHDAIVFLVAAGIVVPVFQRARVGVVLGFLIVGVVVGPYGLGRFAGQEPLLRFVTIDDPSRVQPFAELGIVFLLFLIGLELSLARLWTLRRYVFGAGGIQMALSAVVIGSALAFAGAATGAAIVLGLCLALSSTAVVMQLLIEQGRSASAVGRVALSVLLFQDLMVVPILFVTNLLGPGAGPVATTFILAAAQGVLVVAAILVAGRFVLRPLLRFVGKTGSRDLLLAITLLIVLAVGWATHATGLSLALGAFLAGLLLSETEYRHQVEVDLEPFKGLLIGLFFMTVGMTLDLRVVLDQLGWIIVAVAGLLVVKAAGAYVAMRTFGVKQAASVELALLLAQAGEFAFVVIGLARGNELVPGPFAASLTAVVALSMMATPPLAMLARRAGRELEQIQNKADAPDDMAEVEGHVVIGGFGRVGQTVARLLEREDIAFVALDTDPACVADHRKAGRRVFVGDASRKEMLERAGVARARAVVVTLDAPGAAERMVKAAVGLQQQACVIARAKDSEHAGKLIALGAVGVIPEAVEASLQLAGRVLGELGIPDEVVDRRLDDAREEELGRLRNPSP
jgi:CPA2 family monovalent cation:H+ antiporter-2